MPSVFEDRYNEVRMKREYLDVNRRLVTKNRTQNRC